MLTKLLSLFKTIYPEDIFLWPDSTWCYRYEQYEMTHMSDDYKIVPFDSIEYNKLLEELNV